MASMRSSLKRPKRQAEETDEPVVVIDDDDDNNNFEASGDEHSEDGLLEGAQAEPEVETKVI